MTDRLTKCTACDGRGYHLCDCWPADCICANGDEPCEECGGDGFIDPADEQGCYWDEADSTPPPQTNVRGSLASLVRNEVIPALEATGCNVSLAADVRRALAEERERSVYEFDRYVNGRLMAEGVTVEKAKSFEEAMATAARLASRGPNREVPVLVLRTTPPQPNVALPEAKQLTTEIHGEGHAADEGDPVVDCHRDASQKVSSEGTTAGEQLLSKMPHGHAAWKAEAFDKILAARKTHVDAVAAYNKRLTIVRSERERGNHSMRLDDEYEAMSEAHAAWHRTCQELADAALATTEGSDANS